MPKGVYERALRDPIDRFWSKIETVPMSGCWIWIGALSPGGYGVMGVGRADAGIMPAHRFAYLYYCGEIPNGLELDHLCRVRCCVNPTHLEPVTRRENFLRGAHPTAIRFLSGLCPYGHSMADAYRSRRVGSGRMCRTCVLERYDPVARHAKYEKTKAKA